MVLATLNHHPDPARQGDLIPAPIRIGKNVWIGSNSTILPGVTIGDGTLIGHNVVLATLNHHPDPACRGDLIPAPIRIGKNVWIGSNSTILPGVTIGDNAVIAAGAAVAKDVPANTIAGGVPAKILRQIEGTKLDLQIQKSAS